jgi:hypothetical protein
VKPEFLDEGKSTQRYLGKRFSFVNGNIKVFIGKVKKRNLNNKKLYCLKQLAVTSQITVN